MTADRDQQIAQLQAEIAALQQALSMLAAVPAAQRPLQAQLAEKQQQLAALQAAPIVGPVSADRDVNIATQQTIYYIFGPNPAAAQREQIDRYLDRLAAACYHLPLRGIESRLDRGEGLALPHVYVLLATKDRVEVARGQQARRYFVDNNPARSLKPEFDPNHALPDAAIVEVSSTQIEEPDEAGGKLFAYIKLRRAQLAIEAVQRYPRLVLLGDPGSGKSTFLRHLAWALAHHGRAPDGGAAPRGWDVSRHPLPVLLPLRALAGRLAQDGMSDATMFAALRSEIARHQAPGDDAAVLLDAVLQRDGALLLLLDGLDEIPLEGAPSLTVDRLSTVRAVRDFLRRHTRAAAVLTCRTRAFDDGLHAELGWHVETIAPFTLGQIRAFIPAWFDELTSHGQITPEQARRLGPRLLQAITERPRLRELAGAPLLLTMMALVLYNDGELPRDRPQLYERILKLLLGQWDKVREGQSLADAVGQPDWGSERFLPLLDRLSYVAHRDTNSPDGRGRLARGALYTALIDFFRSGRVPGAWEAASRCLAYFEQRSGLLLADSRDSYVFAHLTLQEHCAGRYIALSTENPVGLALEHRADDRWHEPLLLATGLLRPAEIQTLLADLIDREEGRQPKDLPRWQRDLILAAEIGKDRDWNHLRTLPVVKVDRLQRDLRAGLVALLADPSQPLPIAERVRAGLLLGDLGDPRVPVTIDEWRQAIAGAHAGQNNGYFCPIPTLAGETARWIARYPITNMQLQVWAGPTQLLPYDQERYLHFNQPNQPVSGLNWRLASGFCVWLSQQTGATIRLPTEAEWEAAARGRDGRRYPWGNQRLHDRAATKEDHDLRGWPYPVPVGCYPAGASAVGALDMAGNVWEWTSDLWQTDEESQQSSEVQKRVLRGGGYLSKKSQTLATARIGLAPGAGFDNGFRVLLENDDRSSVG